MIHSIVEVAKLPADAKPEEQWLGYDKAGRRWILMLREGTWYAIGFGTDGTPEIRRLIDENKDFIVASMLLIESGRGEILH